MTSLQYLVDVGLDVEAAEVGVTGSDHFVSRQHLEGARLAGAVDAQQAETLLPRDAQTQPGNTCRRLHSKY